MSTEPLMDRRQRLLNSSTTHSVISQPIYIDSTERVTRRAGATLLKVPKPTITKLARAPVYKGSTLWNALPARTRNSETLLGFKHALAGMGPWGIGRGGLAFSPLHSVLLSLSTLLSRPFLTVLRLQSPLAPDYSYSSPPFNPTNI
jgi:hypothetical protein